MIIEARLSQILLASAFPHRENDRQRLRISMINLVFKPCQNDQGKFDKISLGVWLVLVLLSIRGCASSNKRDSIGEKLGESLLRN